MNDNWSTFLVDEKNSNKLFFPNDWIGNHKAIGLYLPTNPYDWQWRSCSDGHIAPAQKPNRSVTCNSLSTRLPVWFPDRQSCPFIKYNCAPHTCPFRLLSSKPQTYPSVNVWKIFNELATCLYTQVIVIKLPVYPHKHFLAILHGSLQTCRHSYASPYPQIV